MRTVLILILSVMPLWACAQWAVTDAPALRQNIKNFNELKNQVNLLKEQKSKLDESLDFMRKVNSAVSNSITVKNIYDRQSRLTSQCLDIIGKHKLNTTTARALTGSIEQIMSNNRRLLSLSKEILSNGLKMNDSERLSALEKIDKDMREEEMKVYKISSVLREYDRLTNMIDYTYGK